MSLERREQLAELIVDTQPALKDFVRRQPPRFDRRVVGPRLLQLSTRFEVMWDNARIDQSRLLMRPLLLLCRQSVELSIKAAVMEIAGEITSNPGHDLSKLFAQLLRVRADLGHQDDDDYTDRVRSMVALVQSFDPFADRFRYPTAKGGKPFEGIAADFDDLFQAHWMITT